MGEMRNSYEVQPENLESRYSFEDLGEDEGIIFKFVLNK
jgi:hypothetical protein